MKRTAVNRIKQSCSGFTLLETLLLVAVLGVVIVGTFSLSTPHRESRRFTISDHQLSEIRRAVVGDLEAQQEEYQLLCGFVPDMGRLPNNLRELLHQGDLPAWSYDPVSDLWSGWRGPYLSSVTHLNGVLAYPDAWGNPGDTNNFGWRFEPDQNEGLLLVQSYGADGSSGGTGYDLDFPVANHLISSREALIDISGWGITVHLHNPADIGEPGPGLPSTDLTFRVRVYYPEDGSMDWPEIWPPSSLERDEQAYLSPAHTILAGSVSDGDVETIVITFGEAPKLVPFGVRSLGLVDDQDGSVVGDSNQETWRVSLLSRMKLPPSSLAWNLE